MKSLKCVGRMRKVLAIPPEKRCATCAGFGFVYRATPDQTQIFKRTCGKCGGTGEKR